MKGIAFSGIITGEGRKSQSHCVENVSAVIRKYTILRNFQDHEQFM